MAFPRSVISPLFFIIFMYSVCRTLSASERGLGSLRLGRLANGYLNAIRLRVG